LVTLGEVSKHIDAQLSSHTVRSPYAANDDPASIEFLPCGGASVSLLQSHRTGLNDVERDATARLACGGAHNSAQRLGNTAVPANYASLVLVCYAQLIDYCLRSYDFSYLDRLDIAYQAIGYEFDQSGKCRNGAAIAAAFAAAAPLARAAPSAAIARSAGTLLVHGLSLHSSVLEEFAHTIGRLRAFIQPLLGTFGIDLDGRGFRPWIVMAKYFHVAPVARGLGVSNYHAVVGLFTFSYASETDFEQSNSPFAIISLTMLVQ
jgi:hypothetical protein